MKDEEDVSDIIEKWLENNRSLIHEKGLEKCREFIENGSEEEILLLVDFDFGEEVLGKVYIHTDMIKDVLENAQKYFVENEMFEKAAEARDLISIMENK